MSLPSTSLSSRVYVELRVSALVKTSAAVPYLELSTCSGSSVTASATEVELWLCVDASCSVSAIRPFPLRPTISLRLARTRSHPLRISSLLCAAALSFAANSISRSLAFAFWALTISKVHGGKRTVHDFGTHG